MEDNTPDQDPDHLSLPLRKPVTYKGVTYDHLDLSEPDLGTLKLAARGVTAMDQAAILIANNAKIPPAAADLLYQRDVQDAMAFFARFSEEPTNSVPSETPSQS